MASGTATAARYHGAGAVDIRCKGLPRAEPDHWSKPGLGCASAARNSAGARPGPAAPARTDEVGGEDVGGPYWTLGKHHSVEQRGSRGSSAPNTWFPALMLGLMGASALLYSVNTWLPELMRRNGFGQTASRSLSGCLTMAGGPPHRSRSSHCVTHGVNFSVASLLLIVRSRDWARAVPDAELRVRANSYRTNVRGAGVSWCAEFGRLGGTGGPLVGLLIGAGLSFHAIL